MTHTQRWHAHRHSSGSGHLYQGRFKSFPVQQDEHFYGVCRYVEQSALRARLLRRAEEWRWCSLWRGLSGSAKQRSLLATWPLARRPGWVEHANAPQTEAELAALRRSAWRGCPYGDEPWSERMIRRLVLESTVRPQGRPKKKPFSGKISFLQWSGTRMAIRSGSRSTRFSRSNAAGGIGPPRGDALSWRRLFRVPLHEAARVVLHLPCSIAASRSAKSVGGSALREIAWSGPNGTRPLAVDGGSMRHPIRDFMQWHTDRRHTNERRLTMQRILLLTLAATLLVTTAWGEEKPDDKVQAALLEEANFEFIKVPVGKAMDTVRSQYKVKVEFDEGALREAGLDPESVVLEGALNGITLRSALQLALESVGMGYRAEKEAIVVTTAKNAPALKPGKLSQFEEDAYAKLHKKLAAETHIEFIRCPLIDALQYITELHGVQILLDRPAMNAAGLTGEEPVTVKARGVTLRSGLAHLLRAQGLTVIVRCEMLFLTTAEAAETYRDAIDLDQDREPDRLEAVNLKRIEVALDKVDRRKYLEVRLVDFADHLAQRTGVLVFLDRPALEEAEISAETKVSGEETEGPLRDALKSILAKKGLAFVVEHEAIIISPAKE